MIIAACSIFDLFTLRNFDVHVPTSFLAQNKEKSLFLSLNNQIASCRVDNCSLVRLQRSLVFIKGNNVLFFLLFPDVNKNEAKNSFIANHEVSLYKKFSFQFCLLFTFLISINEFLKTH